VGAFLRSRSILYPMKSRAYELLVREIYQQILNQDEVQNVVVEHDVLKQGISTSHQIDVYWEFMRGGVLHRIAVQVKHWKRPVSKGTMLTFKGVLGDLPGTVGVMVTAQGYQKGALEVARKYEITICELKQEAKPNIELQVGSTCKISPKGLLKLAGKPYAMAHRLDFTLPEFSDWLIHSDGEWCQSRGITESATSSMKVSLQEAEFVNSDGQPSCTLQKIQTDMSFEVCAEFNKSGEVGDRKTHVFQGPTLLKASTLLEPIKLKGLSAKVVLNKSSKDVEFPLDNVALFILKNLTDGAVHRFAQLP